MAREEIGVKWDRINRNSHNHNYIELYEKVNDLVGAVTDEVLDEVIKHSKIHWVDYPVDTYDDIDEEYPNPQIGDTVFVKDTGKTFRFDGEDWKNIQELDPSVYNDLEENIMNHINQIGVTEFSRDDDGVLQSISTPTGDVAMTRENGVVTNITEDLKDGGVVKTEIERDGDGIVERIIKSKGDA